MAPILKERLGDPSLISMKFIEGRRLRRANRWKHAVEKTCSSHVEGPFTMAGYLFVMNQEPDQPRRTAEKFASPFYRDIDSFPVLPQAGQKPFLFDDFGLREAVVHPDVSNVLVLDYYEGFELPDRGTTGGCGRGRDACRGTLRPAVLARKRS